MLAALMMQAATIAGLIFWARHRAELLKDSAPDAPSPIKAEATLRVAAYLVAYQPRGVQNIRGGGLNIRFERSRFFAPDPLSNSGALALLAPWRTHRALAIEEPDS